MAQVIVIGPGGARTTANTERRFGETKSEYERLIAGEIPGREGYKDADKINYQDTYGGHKTGDAVDSSYTGDYGGEDASTPDSQRESLQGGGGVSSPGTSAGTSAGVSAAEHAAAMDHARILFEFFPEEVLKAYADKWIEYGDEDLAIAAARTTPAWEKEFGYLKRKDKTLIMTEIEAMAAKASFRETLAEVGIADTSQFEKDFEDLIAGEVAATEFQTRIDLVYDAVKDNIPQVEQMFRDRYQIDTDAPTIFAALISPTINDKLLKGDLKTIGVGAEGLKAGFTRTFAEFEALRKAGMNQQQARQMYSGAQSVIDVGARAGGRDIDISVVEQAALGSKEAQETLTLAAAETQGQSSMIGGARKKDGKVTGLLEQ